MAIDLSRPKRMNRRPEPEQPVESVSVRQSTNGGYTVSVTRKPKDAPKSGRQAFCGPMWEPSKEYVFSTWPDASAFLEKAFGGK